MKKALALLLVFSLALSSVACKNSSSISKADDETTLQNEKESESQDVQTEFDHFLDKIFKEYVTRDALTLHSHLAHPKTYGIEKSTCTNLPSFTEEWFTQKLAQDQASLKSLQEFDRSALSPSQAADYDFLENELTLSIQEEKDYAYYKTYLGKDGCPSVLAVNLSHYYFLEESDITTYFELLKQVPDYLDAFVDYEVRRQENGQKPSRLLIEDTLEEITQFLTYDVKGNLLASSFADRIKAIDSLDSASIESYITENEQLLSKIVLPAYEHLKGRLKMELTPSKESESLASYKKGSKYYALLLRKNVGTDLSADQCEKILSDMQEELLEKSRKLTKENPDLYNTLLGSAPDLTDPEEILMALNEYCQEDFPCLESEMNCQLTDLPDALSSTAASAFFMDPPLDADDRNVIYLNKMRLNTSTLASILAHEGYPGHLYQTSYYQKTLCHPIHRLWRNSGFDEGWGTYAQLYGYNIMNFSNEAEDTVQALRELYANNDLFSLCLCGLSDFYVNHENYSLEDLTTWLAQYGITGDHAEDIYHYVLEQPTSYLTYIIGYHELIQLKEVAEKQEDFSLFDFHKQLLDCKSCPFYLIKKEFSR